MNDTDKLNFVVYSYRNNLYLKNDEVDLNLTEYQSLLVERVYLSTILDWVRLTIFSSGALYWLKQLFITKTKSVNKGCFFSNDLLPRFSGIKIVIWT